MSTRANVILKDGEDKLYFYRHSDGYPEGVKDTLDKFMKWLKEDKIRNNLSQGAGWLIILGAAEYDYCKDYNSPDKNKPLGTPLNEYTPEGESNFSSWKVGAYEPTTCIHGDVEHIYEIDLQKKKLKHFKAENHPEYPKD